MENVDRNEIVKKTVLQMLNDDFNAIAHLVGVAYLSGYIAVNRKLNTELCICAGMLHDLWLYRNLTAPDIYVKYGLHGQYGSSLARELLKETMLYSDDEIEIVCRMIYNHHDKASVHDEYSEVLKDADALQHYLNNSEYDRTRYKYYGRIEKLIQNKC